MRIIVISLLRALDRRKSITEHLSSLGLAYEFLDATDGQTITDKERALVDHNKRRWVSSHPLSDNEIGCWLSHKRAMQKILDDDMPMALIMEDDTRLSEDIISILKAIEEKAANFDVIALHQNKKRGVRYVRSRALLPGLSLGRLLPMNMGGYAYVVSREGARKFLNYTDTLVNSFDKALHRYWANGLDIYCLERSVAEGTKLEHGYSYIEETRKNFSDYDDAGSPVWRCKRLMVRILDSLWKRLATLPYLRRGRDEDGMNSIANG